MKSSTNKPPLNEQEARTGLILPQLKASGWQAAAEVVDSPEKACFREGFKISNTTTHPQHMPTGPRSADPRSMGSALTSSTSAGPMSAASMSTGPMPTGSTSANRFKNLLEADYVLQYKRQNLAVIEAKKPSLSVREGIAQAKKYAQILQVDTAFATNGHKIYQICLKTGHEAEVSKYPTPDKLWQKSYGTQNAWQDRFQNTPHRGNYELRFYQHIAVDKVLEAVAKGQKRILLTMATGTGKTKVAFQVVWKLYQARWSLSSTEAPAPLQGAFQGAAGRRPKILFLTDRNILANQAMNEFENYFPGAVERITPNKIRKKQDVPKSSSIYFSIFQTLCQKFSLRPNKHASKPTVQEQEGRTNKNQMSMQTNPDALRIKNQAAEADQTETLLHFKKYDPDFFDFIIVDECHRGGANDESTWREILDYFEPAVQLGLTATPKRDDNVNTYEYFGQPVYTYSLKNGIEHGYLTPFRVKKIQSNIDEYEYAPDDDVIEGEPEQGKLYKEEDFNNNIEIRAREEHRVKILLHHLPPNEKALVFCANQGHAAFICELINQNKPANTPVDYCVRVTANDGPLGEEHLSRFQDNEKTIPTVLTTSRKLSTGVDAQSIRHIVLLRPIQSMIEFKQIIGRGTRLFDGKKFFTVFDFVKACDEHLIDPDWDGEALQVEKLSEDLNTAASPTPEQEAADEGVEADDDKVSKKSQKVKIQLSASRELALDYSIETSFMNAAGDIISASEFIRLLYGQLPQFFKTEDELRHIWSHPRTRQELLDKLAAAGFKGSDFEQLKKLIQAPTSDVFDVLQHIAFNKKPLTRFERVEAARVEVVQFLQAPQIEFIDFVLQQYLQLGVEELGADKLTKILRLKYKTLHDAAEQLGPLNQIKPLFIGFQKHLYQAPAVN